LPSGSSDRPPLVSSEAGIRLQNDVAHAYRDRRGPLPSTVARPSEIFLTITFLPKSLSSIEPPWTASFGRIVVASPLTLAIVTGMSISDISRKAIANLGWTDIVMRAPVFIGDTLYAESEVMAKSESQPGPARGIVTVATRGLKADGTLCISFMRYILIPKRPRGRRRMRLST
jgi:itaconyl-CoA hydratase